MKHAEVEQMVGLDLPAMTRLLLLLLRSAGTSGTLDVPELGKQMRCTERTVQQCLAQLGEHGLLVRSYGGGRGVHCTYQLCIAGETLPRTSHWPEESPFARLRKTSAEEPTPLETVVKRRTASQTK